MSVLFTTAAKVCRSFSAIVAFAGVKFTLMPVVNVMVTLADTAGSALLLACTVTDPPAGRASGAAYVVLSGAVCEFWINPTYALPPTIPSTSQVTVVSCTPATVAWNACEAPSATAADDGKMDTLTAGIMETETEAVFDGSACGVATICTVAGDGGCKGAAYTPPEEIVPHAAAAQPDPATLQEITRLGFELAAGVSVAV